MVSTHQPPSHPPPPPPRSPSTTSSSTSSHITPHFCHPFPATTKKHLLLFLRTVILLLSLTTLTLDIATISFNHTHHYRNFPLQFYLPSSSSPPLRDEAFIPLVLVPDITAVVIMIILLWESAHLRLRDRWWRKWYFGVRVLFGVMLVGVGVVEPSMEAVYYAQSDNGLKEYFCVQPTRVGREKNEGGPMSGGAGWFANIDRDGTYTGGSDINNNNNNNNNSGNYYRTTNIQQCKLLCSRSILTLIWLLLVLLELLFAYSLGEFRSRSQRTRREQQSGLGSATGNCGGGGGGGGDTKRPASIGSSELWYKDQYHPNRHNNNQQQYNNDRTLDLVEEIDYEDYEDEEEDDVYSYATSSRVFTLQEVSQPQSQPQHINRCVEAPMQ